jgi:hypothetical protein
MSSLTTRPRPRAILAAIGVAALVALSLGVDAPPASAHDYRKEFDCGEIDGEWPPGWGNSTHQVCELIEPGGADLRWPVPDGHKMCFAVQGSDGHPVLFRARAIAANDPDWVGTTNHGIVWDEHSGPSACLRANDTGEMLQMRVKARTTDGASVAGTFTAYTCHPGESCFGQG